MLLAWRRRPYDRSTSDLDEPLGRYVGQHELLVQLCDFFLEEHGIAPRRVKAIKYGALTNVDNTAISNVAYVVDPRRSLIVVFVGNNVVDDENLVIALFILCNSHF